MAKKYPGTKNLLERGDSILIVIDVQDKLMPVIANKGQIIHNIVRLLKFSKIIGLPVILTEQEKLGSTVSEIKNEIPDVTPYCKVCF